MIQLTVEIEQSLKDFTDNYCAQASFFWMQLLKNKDIVFYHMPSGFVNGGSKHKICRVFSLEKRPH